MSFKIRFPRPLLVANLVSIPIIAQLVGFAMGWPLMALVVCTFFTGVGFSINGMIWFTTLQRLIPGESLSRVSSFDWFGSLALNPLGYALIGPFSAVVGERKAMGYATVLLAAAILVPLIVSAVVGLRLPPIKVDLDTERETDAATT
jgi:MFS family permease